MKKHNIILYFLFLLSIAIVLTLYFFDSFRIPCLWDINHEKINQLLEVLSLSYITSFLFYIIVVRIKEYEEKKVIMPFIAEYSFVLLNNCVIFSSIMRGIASFNSDIDYSLSINNRNIKIYPNNHELKNFCKTINPNLENEKSVNIEGITQIPHFFGFMIKTSIDIDYYLNILLEKSSFMEVELLRILTDIKTSGYHKHMVSYGPDKILTSKHRHDNLLVFEKPFIKYFNLMRELEIYSRKELSKHVKRADLLKERI